MRNSHFFIICSLLTICSLIFAVIPVMAATNTAPTLSLDNTPLTYIENQSSILIDDTGEVNDPNGDGDWDGGMLEIQITSNAEMDDLIGLADVDMDQIQLLVSSRDLYANGVIVAHISADNGEAMNNVKLIFTFNAGATNAIVQELLQSLRYMHLSEDPVNSNKTITVSVTDKYGASKSDTRTINIVAVNDEPTITATGLNPTFTEGGSAVLLFNNTSASTMENSQKVKGFTMTISNINDGINEILIVDGTNILLSNGTSGSTVGNSLSYSVGLTSATASITIDNGALSTSVFENIINNISYHNISDDVNNTNKVVTITNMKDNGGTDNEGDDTVEVTIESTVTMIPINDKPALTATGLNPTYFEGKTPALLYNLAAASTIEQGQLLTDFTITITNINDGESENLVIDDTNIGLTHGTSGTTATNNISYSVSLSSTTATITFSGGSLSVTDMETVVNTLAYQNISNNPNTINRVVTITTLTDNGGTSNGGDNNTTLSIESTVTVLSLNDPPTISSTGNNPTFTEGGTSVVLFSNSSVSTVDIGQKLIGFAITISNVYNHLDEQLNIDGSSITLTSGTTGSTASNNISYNVSVLSNTATINFSMPGITNAVIESVIDAISYLNKAENPNTLNRVVTITELTDDGGTDNGGNNTAALNIESLVSITAVNDEPWIAINTGITIDEGATKIIGNTKLKADDLDDSGTGLLYTLTSDLKFGTLFTDNNDNGIADDADEIIGLNEIFTQADIDNGRLKYTHDDSENFSDSFNFSLSDGGENGTSPITGTFNITITTINDNAPVITTASPFLIDEDAANSASVGTVTATDADGDTAFSEYAITGGNTDGIFSIDPNTGEITVADNTNLDREETAQYTLLITVSDGTNTGEPGNIIINIGDINDTAPLVTQNQIFTVDENCSDNSSIGMVLASDADTQTLFSEWTITGGNTDNAFAINGSSGEITVNNSGALDRESVDHFDLLITVSDGTNISVEETVIINLFDVNEYKPEVIASQSSAIDENSINGTPVMRVDGSDGDATYLLQQWAIVDGNINDAFAIDPSTGDITVNNTLALDWETIKTFELSIVVSDDKGDMAKVSSPEIVTININDVFEMLDQTVSFEPLAQMVYGDTDFELTAETSSGLPLVFTSSNTGVATINGNTVIITGAGTTSITASQPGSELYNAADDVMRDLNVNKAMLNAAADDKTKTYGEVNPELTVSYSGFVNGDDASVLNTPPTLTSMATSSCDCGTYSISVAGGVDNDYDFSYTDATMTVVKAEQSIDFNLMSSIIATSPAITLEAYSSSGLPVSFESSDPSTATVDNNKLTLMAAGSVNIIASQEGNHNFMAATPITHSLNIDGDDTLPLSFTIYPVPCSNKLHIDINPKLKGVISLEVVSLSGRKVLTKAIELPQKIALDVYNNEPGVYLLIIKKENETITKRWIKI